MKIIKYKTETFINNFVDHETGEILDVEIETKHHKKIVDNKEAFFWTFLSIESMFDDLDKVSMKVLFYCNMNCSWNSNKIALTKPALEEIEEKMGLKYQTVRNAISKLKKLKILIDLGGATYRINPKYYWRGDTDSRLKTLNYVFEVECRDCIQ